MLNKIAILIPYFGEQPSWFDYYILSCKKNPEIDWLFFSDCLEQTEESPNLKFFKMSQAEFNTLASVNLGFEVSIKNAYKICDFKPTYGKVFEAYIQDYKFWAYGDIDVIYGNILKFLPINWEEEFELISNHKNFIPGHLCILKNSGKVKSLYTQIPFYQKILQSAYYEGFDEKLLPVPIHTNPRFNKFFRRLSVQQYIFFSKMAAFKNNGLFRFFYSKTETPARQIISRDFTTLVQSMLMDKKLKANFATTYNCDVSCLKNGYKDWEIVWRNGELFDSTNKPIMYFHFQLAKANKHFRVNVFKSDTAEFHISPNGIDWKA